MNHISPEAAKVREALRQKGIETPMIVLDESKDERRTHIEQHMREVLRLIGLDLRDDSIEETPARLAKMFVDEIFSGLDYANFPKITNIANRMKVSEMVLVNDVTLTSTCEHHFVTIDGMVSVAYYPKKWVIGLSKINRVVAFFCSTSASTGTLNGANFIGISNDLRNGRCRRLCQGNPFLCEMSRH